MPLVISEGYHHGCHFEAMPVLSGRVHFHQVGGVRDLQLRRDKNPEMSQLCFGTQAYLAACSVKALTLLVHSFANCVMWYKIALVLRLWLFGGGAPRPSFLLHDSRSRRVPLPDQLPFFAGPFLDFGTKSSHFFGASSCFPLYPSVVNGICLLDPTLFSFLADSENSDRWLPAFIPF